MKKYLILLIIPLLFFSIGCEEEENNSIIGTWRDNIEGDWVITSIEMNNTMNNTYIELENPNYSLVDGSNNLIFDNCYCYCGSVTTENTNDNGQSHWVYGTWDNSTNSLDIYCGNGGGDYESDTSFGLGTEYHEIITFYENGTYSYQVSPTIWQYDGDCSASTDAGNIGDTFPQIPMQPFVECSTGSWSSAGNMLTINGFTFNTLIDGDNLTLDRSLIGSAVDITTWERQN